MNSNPLVTPDYSSGGISTTSIDPSNFVGATVQDSGGPPKHSKTMYIVIFITFAILAVISIGTFVYLNSQGAKASTGENRYAELSAQLSSTPAQVTEAVSQISPTPTFLLPTIRASATVTPEPTFTPRPSMSIESPTPTPRLYSWEIRFEKNSYTSADFQGAINPAVTGTLFTPRNQGSLVCYTNTKVFFTKKKDSSTIERLCDNISPTPQSQPLTCVAYEEFSGVPITATLYPRTNCSEPNQPVESGAYIMSATIYYDCAGAQVGINSINASSCANSREVFSYDLYYSN